MNKIDDKVIELSQIKRTRKNKDLGQKNNKLSVKGENKKISC